MASRAEQKAQLRAEREAREQAEAAAKVKRQRFAMIGGVVVIAVVVAIVAIAISSGGKTTDASAATDISGSVAQATDLRVSQLLAGIPQESDNVLGKADAPVTITEYGDLECSICDEFALPTNINTSDGSPGTGIEDQIIDNLVKTGKAKFEYDSLETATGDGATPQEFVPQQAAAYAAGMQDKAWNYIELFYNEQGQEGTDYVKASYLDGIAKQIPGLNYAQWQTDMTSQAIKDQITSEIAEGTKLDNGSAGTPTIVVQGPHTGPQVVSSGIPTYDEVASAVKTVS